METEEKIAVLWAERDEMKNELKAARQDIQDIKILIAQGQGGWKVLVAASAVAGAAISFLGNLIIGKH